MDSIKLFFEQFTSASSSQTIGILDMLFILALTFLLGLFVTFIYRLIYSGVSMSYKFLTSLLVVSLVTTMVVLTIRSNIVVSLGMVGALSIIRFRTPLKEPLDLAFMFWAVAIGITMGALLFDIALLFSLFIGVALTIFTKIKNTSQVYLLIIEYNNKSMTSRAVDDELAKIKYVLRSKRVTDNMVELNLEITQLKMKTDIINNIGKIDGVESVSLIGYNGDYLG
ncbi:DUF4956 domain-containing protein [Mycoplasmatota bacterium WC44]